MRVHYLQHVPFEGIGSISTWIEKNGHKITKTCLFDNSSTLPKFSDVDFLIVLGGPMSVNDERVYNWLNAEKQYIKECILSKKPVLGICLGAQLIASAMGAKVYKNDLKEIGWFNIESVNPVEKHVFKFPPSMEVFHWHGETFDLPKNAVHLAKSDGCKNQAFQLGDYVLGLQFHLETTPLSLKDIINNCKNEITPSQYIQNEDKMLLADTVKYNTINGLMNDVLNFLTRNI